MTHPNMVRFVCLMLLLIAVVLPRDVHAYLDPGTGSLVFQAVVAALAAVAYALRSYWGRIRILFGHHDSPPPIEPHDGQV